VRPRRAEGDPLWFKDAVIYELHVRAFFDSDANGIGERMRYSSSTVGSNGVSFSRPRRQSLADGHGEIAELLVRVRRG